MRKKKIVSILLCSMMAASAFGLFGVPVSAADNKELTYWSMWESTENQAEVIQEAAEAYEAATNVHVNIEWKGRGIKDLIGAALDAGEEIDLFDDDFQRIIEQDGQYLADLTEMASGADYEKHMMPVLREQARGWGGDKLLVMPYQPYTTGVWYNKDLWEEAGLTEEEVPETWDELLAVCEKIKEGESGLNAMTCDSEFVNLLYGFQLARYVGQDKVMEIINNCQWVDVPQAKKAAEEIQSLFLKGYMSSEAPAEGREGQNEIGYGQSIMVLQASWVPNEVIQDTGTDVNWGFFPWPAVEGGVDGIEGSMVGSQGFGIVEKSDMKQEAFDFAVSICTGEYDLKMADAVQSVPADTDNTQWPEAILGAEPYFKNITKPYMWAVGFQTNADYKEVIQEHLINLATVKETPEEFIQALAAEKTD